MLWEQLKWNLLSEAVGIAFTVFIVDRLLSWHEKRHWKEARAMFNALARRESDAILAAWKEWCSSISAMPESLGLDDSEKMMMLEMGYGAVEGAERMVALYLGTPLGSGLKELAKHSDRKTIASLNLYLAPFLTPRIPSGKDPWISLSTNLAPPVHALEDLVRTYAALLDPTLAAKILRLAAEVKNLADRSYETVLSRKEKDIRSARIAAAMCLAHSLQDSIELAAYLYRESKPSRLASWIEDRKENLEDLWELPRSLWEELQNWRSQKKK